MVIKNNISEVTALNRPTLLKTLEKAVENSLTLSTLRGAGVRTVFRLFQVYLVLSQYL